MSWRIVYYAACVLVLAGITHIVVILLIPTYGTKDAFDQLASSTEPLSFRILDENERNSPLTDIDPFFTYGLCRFELVNEGVLLRGPKTDLFWSATILDRNGTVVYSLNSRTAIDNQLGLILLNPVQILRLRELQPPEVDTSIVVEADIDGGFVVMRVLRPDDNWDKKSEDYLQSVECNSYVPTLTLPEETDAEEPQS